MQRFIDLYGDLPSTAINKAHGRGFRDALTKIPKRMPNRLARLTTSELLKQDLGSYPPRSAQTINKVLALMGGVFARAERDGFFESMPGWANPFHVGFEISGEGVGLLEIGVGMHPA